MFVMVCICTCRRDDLLHRLLLSFSEIDLPLLPVLRVEVLVINNAPNPATEALCRSASQHIALKINYTEEKRPGVVPARNKAVAYAFDAEADVIAFIDDDDLPSQDWLKQLLLKQLETGADVVCGDVRYSEAARPSWKKDKEMGSKATLRLAAGFLIPKIGTNNMLVTMKFLRRFKENGPVFNDQFGKTGAEDRDFLIRVAQSDGTFAVAENSIVTVFNEASRFSYKEVFRRGYASGCADANIALHHESILERLRLLFKAGRRLFFLLISFPYYCFARKKLPSYLFRMAKAMGVIRFSIIRSGSSYYQRG